MQIVEKKITELKAYDKNPRKNDNAVEPVAESIKEFGFKVPIIIDSDGVIVAGHTRLRAAKKLRMKTVPCIVADDLTPEQIKAFRLADNKVSEFAEWDIDLLTSELKDIDFDMDIFGFDEDYKEIKRTDLSYKDFTAFQIVIDCDSEEQQELYYNKLVEEGYKCKVLTL